MTTLDKEYTKHHVFSELDTYIKFYDALATSIFSFCSTGTRAACNIDSYVYSSMKGTLESVKAVLSAGRISDAYALLRRFHDSAVINLYSIIYLEDSFSIDNLVVEQIDNWLRGKDRLPEYRVMSQYIKDSPRLRAINVLLYSDVRYKAVRDRCNDNMHYNFFESVLLNDGEVHVKSRSRWLDALSSDLRDLVTLHVSCAFFLNDHYMMSSDHLDYLDCGLPPTPGSEYWVAPFVQTIFDELISIQRPDIAALIKSNSKMMLA